MNFRRGRRSRPPNNQIVIPRFVRSREGVKRNGASTWKARIPVLTVAVLILYLFVSGQLGLWRLLSLWQLRGDLRAQQTELTVDVVDLEMRRQRLESDDSYIEEVARTEYHMSRPDEIVYDIVRKR